LQADPESETVPYELMEIPQLHVVFSEREFLEKRDKKLLKSAGVKLTDSAPMFRSNRPGYISWFVPAIEHVDSSNFLVRVPVLIDTGVVWEDRIQNFTRPTRSIFEPTINSDSLIRLKRFPQSDNRLEADLFSVPGGVGERDERPLQLYMLLVADSETGVIYGGVPMTAELGFEALQATVPEHVLRLLLDAELLPKQITVRSERLVELLAPLSTDLKIHLECSSELPAIEAVVESLLEQMGLV
jgi:hypothetical protein